MELIPATNSDLALCTRLIQKFYAQEPGMRPLDDAEARSKVQDIFAAGADKRVYCLLLRHTGNIVGYALMVPYFSSEYGGCVVVLDELFILPELQGQGLGGRALEALKAWSREQGMKRVILEVTEKNSRVMRLYERGGFTRLDRRLMSWETNDWGSGASPV